MAGTPLQNNLHELYALLNYMYPQIFDTPEPFDACFDLTQSKCDASMLEKAHFMLKPFILRRIKAEVELGLPVKEEFKIKVPLSEMQVFWYERLLAREQRILDRKHLVGTGLEDGEKIEEDSEWKR